MNMKSPFVLASLLMGLLPFLQASAGRRTDQLAELVDVSRIAFLVQCALLSLNGTRVGRSCTRRWRR